MTSKPARLLSFRGAQQLVLLWAMLLMCASMSKAADKGNSGQKIRLIDANVVQFHVTTSVDAAEEINKTAAILADYLERISGNRVAIQTGDGRSGIAVGVAEDFPELGHQPLFDSHSPFRRSEYLLRTHSNGLQIIGASPQAVEFGVWDLLYRMGDDELVIGHRERLRLPRHQHFAEWAVADAQPSLLAEHAI